MSKKLTKRPVVEYTEFLKSLDVIFLALSECEAKVDRRQFFKSEEGLGMAARADWTKSESEKDAFNVRAEITIRTVPKNKKDGSLRIKAVYIVHLHTKPPFDEEHIKRFVRADLRLLIWPYFREFIASITARMHIPPITLPLTGGKSR